MPTKEKVIRSEVENGRYLIYKDVADYIVRGVEKTRAVYAVFFQLDYEKDDMDCIKSFETLKEAERFAKGRVAEARDKFPALTKLDLAISYAVMSMLTKKGYRFDADGDNGEIYIHDDVAKKTFVLEGVRECDEYEKP